MNEQERQTEPTRAESRGVAIALLMLLVMLGAIVLQNLQQAQTQDMVVYVSEQTVYVAPTSGAWQQPLFSLNADCMLFWKGDAVSGGAFPAEMAQVTDANSTLPAGSHIALEFTARGSFNAAVRDGQATLSHAEGTYMLFPACITTPSSQVWDIAVYEYNRTLYVSNLLTGRTVTMMPLRNTVVWSSDTSFAVTANTLAGQFDERELGMLPYGAEVIRTFSTSTLVEVYLLDEQHTMLRYGGGEITIVSYDAPTMSSLEHRGSGCGMD